MEPSCPADAVFSDLLDGRLAPGEAQALQVHIAQCSACFALLGALARTADLAEAAAEPDGDEPALPMLAALPAEYQIIRPLGQGAMGQVYLAEDRLLDRLVAIKFLTARQPDAAARARFLTEARAVARLSHPHVAAIYQIGEAAGQPYLVTEYVPGKTLREIDKPLPWPQALTLAVGLSRGLAAAHQAGVLHRDLKPANAILGEDGVVKLLDFGLAKLLDSAAPTVDDQGAARSGLLKENLADQTQHGVVLGTPLYLAPELWRGAAASPASDVYALGAVVYELLVGCPPLRADSLAELARRAQEEGAAPLWLTAAAVPAALAEVVDRCLRRDPAARFPSAVELCLELESLLRAASPAAPGPASAVRERLEAAAAEWARLGMPAAALWSAPQLREAAATVALTPLGEAFLRHSRRAQVAYTRGVWVSVLLLLAVPALLWLARAEVQRGAARTRAQAAERRLEQGLEATVLLQRPGQEVAALLRAVQSVAESRITGEPMAEPALLALGAALEAAQRALPLPRLAGSLLTAAFSSDGQSVLLVTTPAQGQDTVRIHRIGPLGEEAAVIELRGHRGSVYAAAFSSQGDLLVSGGEDGARLWEVRSGRLLATLAAGSGPVYSVAVGAGLVVTAGQDGAARIFDAGAVTPRATLRGHAGPVTVARLTADGARLATGSRDGSLRLWDVAAARARAVLVGHHERIRALAFAGHLLASGGDDGVRLWDGSAQGEASPLATVTDGAVAELAFSPADDGLLAAAGADGVARVFALRAPPRPWAGGGAALALEGARGPLRGLVFAPDGRRLLTISQDESAQRWDLAPLGDDALPAQRPLTLAHSCAVLALAVTGDLVVSGGADGAARLWDARTLAARGALLGHGAAVTSVAACSQRGATWVLTGSADGTARLWDAGRGAPRTPAVLRGSGAAVNAVALACDGAVPLLLTAASDGDARLWRGDRPEGLLRGHVGPVLAAALAPDGARAATGGRDGTVRLWSVRERRSDTLGAAAGAVAALAFSADGQTLFSTSSDGSARRWDVATQAQIAILPGHAAPLRALALSADALRVLTVGEDHSARLIDARPGQAGPAPALLAIFTGALRSGALSADGRWVVLGDAGGVLRALPAPQLPEVSLAAACAVLGQQPEAAAAERACAPR